MLRITTFGGLVVHQDGRALTGAAAQPRRLAVLALLACAGTRGLTREKLLACLWPDADEERGRRTLNQALYALRRELGSDDVIVGLKDLRLNADLVTSDVAEFRDALAAGESERAISLYRGPFLDGFHLPGAAEFERWAEGERAALAQDCAGALERLAKGAAGRGDHSAAIGWWRKLAAQDPLNARVAVALMRALDAAGDRAGALHHARIYEVLVEQELDLPPDREVVALAERLRVEAAAPPGQTPRPVPAITASGAGPADGVATRPAAAPPAAATDAAAMGRAIAVAEPPRAESATSFRGEQRPSPVVPPPSAPPSAAPGQVGLLESARTVEAAAPESATVAERGVATRYRVALAAALLGAAVMGAFLLRGRVRVAATQRVPVLAVGRIAAYEPGSAGGTMTGPLADLLATNLARVRGLRVVSGGRMLELVRQVGNGRDTSAGALTAAARLAGATEVLDGTLYALAGGRLRLDLRRVELATGDIVGVQTVEGGDLFALVDSGTARIVAELGVRAPSGSVADVTTHSATAYQLYVEGLRRYYELDVKGAERLFAAALAEDSSFAMAAYYRALTSDFGEAPARMERAVRLAARATDRERLMIKAGWAYHFSSPELQAVAETLAARYPDEVHGHFYLGAARSMALDFFGAIPHIRRAMAMDSLALRAKSADRVACFGCEARQTLIYVYHAADSLDAAVREARKWAQLQPSSAAPWLAVADLLYCRGRPDEALAALERARTADGGGSVPVRIALARHWVFAGDFARSEALLRALAEGGTPAEQTEAHWYLALAYRERGRLSEALAEARRYRSADIVPSTAPGSTSREALLEALMLDELGQHREAAALFDSASRWRVPELAASFYARNRVWMLTHGAGAHAAAGDVGALFALADTVRAYGAQSGLGRDQRLFHHVRGLALAARGDDEAAVAEFRAAVASPTLGYARTTAELARALLRLGRPTDAVSVLQPALRGGSEASNLYFSRTALHELLARAWEAAGRADSAAAHYGIVARDWAQGDAPYRARAAAAGARIVALARH